MLELVQLGDLAKRKSTQLSGGQQQRVALARALAPEPRVLLLDEPLSALDLKLRQAMRSELKQIQQETGITFVFVTHDQEEALTMSDRIAVMSQGKVQQVGMPEEIYREPGNRFVADFIGETNFLEASLEQVDGSLQLARLVDGSRLQCVVPPGTPTAQKGVLCIRPESLRISSGGDEDSSSTEVLNRLSGTIQNKIFLGTDTQWIVRMDTGVDLVVREQNTESANREFGQGKRVFATVDTAEAKFLVE